jgi:hypothetical protein
VFPRRIEVTTPTLRERSTPRDRDEFIITVYCLVCEHYQVIKTPYPLRRGGFAPALSDEEVLTLEICGEYFKLATDKDLFTYFRTHSAHFLPRLTDRTLFVRQAANLWQVKAAIPQRLTQVSGQAADPVQIIDTLPLPVCCLYPQWTGPLLQALGRLWLLCGQEAGLLWVQAGIAHHPV